LVQSPPSAFGNDSIGPRINGGRSSTRQLKGRSRSGKELTVLMTMTSLDQENGDPAALIGTAVDVTAAAEDHRGLKQMVALVEEKSARIEAEAELARVSKEAERLRLEAEADRITAEGEKRVAEGVRLEAEADRITAEREKKDAERVRIEAEADRLTAEDEKRVAEGVRLEDAAHRKQLEAQ